MKKFLKSFNFKIIFFNLKNLPYSFLVKIIFVFSLAYLVNTFLEYKFFSIPKPIFNINNSSSKQSEKINYFYLKKLFFVKGGKEKILLTTTKIKLIGTVLIGKERLALIKTSDGKLKFFKVGEKVDGIKIIKIGKFYIEIQDNEGIKRIYIDLKGKLKEGNKKRFDKNISIKNAENSFVLRIVKNIIFKPYRSDILRGIKIDRILDDSLGELLGLKEGDIIVYVNRTPAISTSVLINKVLSAINNKETIELIILRNGREVRLIYNGDLFK